MKTRRFDFNYKPLQLQNSFVVDGTVPDKQDYSTDTGEYTPDYTKVPLIIQPLISILDKDEILPAARINNKLTNVRWYENIGGTRKLIVTDNTDYEVTSSGGNAGRIKVKRNAEPKIPITLEFYAEYVDSRNSQVSTIQGTYSITCSSSADLVRVELDAGEQNIYNPLDSENNPRQQIVTATVWVGEKVADASTYAIVWEVMGEDATWHVAESDELMDYDITVNGGSVTIDKQLMGEEMHLRARVKYSAEGDPDSVELTDASPCATVTFSRRIPKFDFDMEGVPYNIPPGTLQLAPVASIRTSNEAITSDTYLLPLWYIATNKPGSSLSYKLVGHGLNPVIDTSAMDSTNGAVIAMDVIDRGAAGAFVDAADGAAFVDAADGSIIII